MKKTNIRRTCFWLVVVVSLQACLPAPLPVQTPQSVSPQELGTIVAGTAAVAQTQTAILMPPSPTPTVTRTPSQTPTPVTPTATFFFFVYTSTPIPTRTPFGLIPSPAAGSGATATLGTGPGSFTGREWTCGISENPYKIVEPKETFSMFVTLRNTGTKTWPRKGVDFVYRDGYRHVGTRIQDLPATVTPGNRVTLEVVFVAPRDRDTYNAFWDLKVGRTTFCGVRLLFEVR